MRRSAVCLIIVALATPLIGFVTPTAQAQAPAPGVPHAWLYGAWTGGIFPVTSAMTPQACLSQPVVIFTKDIVMRATLIDPIYHQRIIETVRSEPNVTDFKFAPAVDGAASLEAGLLGSTPPRSQSGFGCPNPDTLHVVRRSANEIVFEGCKDFPEPLVRCQPQ